MDFSTNDVGAWVDQLPTAQAWLSWLASHGPKDHCKCEGFGPNRNQLYVSRKGVNKETGPPFWEYLADLDSFHAVSGSYTYIGGLREFLISGGMLDYFLANIQQAVVDCPHGSATFLLLALSTIEEIWGIVGAQRSFSALVALVAFSRTLPCRFCFRVFGEKFAGNSLVPNFGKLVFLLGMLPSKRRCFPGSPKIFVYHLDKSFVPSPMLACARGLAATEIWVHKQLLQSDCRTEQVEEADLFYVPLYGRCLYSLKNDIFEFGYSWQHPFANASEWYMGLIGRLPFLKSRPRDHVFLFPEERWPVPEAVFRVRGALRHSIVLSPEARRVSCDAQWRSTGYMCVHLPPRASQVVIPSFVDSWRASLLQQHNLPLNARDVLACFMGLGVAKEYSVTQNYRGLLQPLTHLPDFRVGDYTSNYAEVMGNSVFCMIPKGVGTWSHRLYEAFLSGCIPVILSDDVRLPFPELPWNLFSLKWPMREVDNVTFPTYLRSVSTARRKQLKANVDLHACWFDYHTEDNDCSPLLGITRQLRERGAEYGPVGFW
eukprot:TRINITY_DN48233_c0_g1_i1.p1 TRINITY_DN48233_c0_g1~~TRINITY_DN48233_c0_g1_i1.p1  ORF type:complete len:543 (+),score=31.86 TRINITY_DN48233_c0_g1_i1:124-1752(+)